MPIMHDGHATHLRSPRPGRCLGPFPASGERKRSLISSPICVYLRMDTYHQATVHLDALFPCCLYGVLIDPFIDVVRLGQVLLVQRLDHFRDKALAEHGASARLLLPLLSVHRKNTYHTRQKFAPPWAAAGKDNALACGRREAQSAWSEMWATVRRERAPASLARQSGPRKRTRQSVEGGKRQRRAARLYERCLLRHGGGGYESRCSPPRATGRPAPTCWLQFTRMDTSTTSATLALLTGCMCWSCRQAGHPVLARPAVPPPPTLSALASGPVAGWAKHLGKWKRLRAATRTHGVMEQITSHTETCTRERERERAGSGES